MWFQLKIEHCPNDKIEEITEELEEYGALSIMLTDKNDDPVLEPEPGTTPLWPDVIIHALFAQAEEAQYARKQLVAKSPSLHCSLETLADKNWERAWMEDFQPHRFGNRLWVCPTWLTPPEPDAVNLMLDPGLAFGTGTHATTSLCLTWLEQADLKNKSIIDYGCGSGILSLAAIKLGAKHVYAVDIDNQALQATQNNAHVNHIKESQLSISSPEALQNPVNLIIANILLAPLISLKERFHQLLPSGAHLVTSGILEEQAPLLIEAYDSAFTHTSTEYYEGWALLVFTSK
ncbi:TPA: 50S ribosomal protein L11 methyltransferase [Legionella pneumophila]|uniref:Ribosomal protein L11 methyltransferase n=1 Tax=Legionella pneumophila TaxID=446 RepID=A0AAN5KQD1_LEGPN|nr:50S ribosomal protein L11 methyltransferase [Legionella pneumophila]HAT1972344.1 50S ribosomal protein L11 methyltransferase [Legionella pneumophila]HAT6956636.1 50S ribosomal protein L11 methyltransferase [Legionella pneumophila]HEN4770003.1 50S ribosomal protein L11 methyltransferase [Legionella pneumophila]